MGTKRTVVVTTVVLFAVAYYSWWLFWSGDNFHRHSANADNRAAILRLHSALQVGDPFDKVLTEYWSQGTEELRLHLDARDRWLISMPSEFGANDWTLVLEYLNGRVSAIRIRETWNLLERPRTLREVLQQLSQKGPEG